MPRSKTITIFLKDSEINGIKIADLSNSAVRVYVIPRNKIEFVQTRSDLTSPTLYMLFDDDRTTVYIGESENFQNRIIGHIANKDFWQWAVVCVTTGSGLDKAQVKFLESHAIQKAVEIGRFNVQNLTNPEENSLHEFRRATTLDLFEDFELLVTTLGFNLFEPTKERFIEKLQVTKRETITEKDVREYDTIIGPAYSGGRVDAFEKENAWWAVRIGKTNIPKLKYVGLYETAPISAIRIYAKIKKIELYPEEPGRYIIYHDGNIQTLDNPIVLADHPELALFGPRYYKLEDIKNSKTMAELTDRTFGSDYQGTKTKKLTKK